MDELEQLKRNAGITEIENFVELPNAEYRNRPGGPKMEDRVPPKNWPNMITGELKEGDVEQEDQLLDDWANLTNQLVDLIKREVSANPEYDPEITVKNLLHMLQADVRMKVAGRSMGHENPLGHDHQPEYKGPGDMP